MIRHIFLDSSPLGLLSNPTRSADVTAITDWMMDCLAAGHKIYIPEVIDYELRRELLRAGKVRGIAKLDSLKSVLRYVPLTTTAMLRAANLWAMSRRSGLSTGDPRKLDVDVILCAQALTVSEPAATVVVATGNVGHIARFVSADVWTNIAP